MSLDYAVHSDFLIHWTGKDLDSLYDPHWDSVGKNNAGTDSSLVEKYLERLHSILKYGLWLTTEPECCWSVDDFRITVPSTPKVCFTELKLSESIPHARRYGRLGIGVKRPYLFDRSGRPLAYFGFNSDQWRHDHFLKSCARELSNPDLLNFFKPMNSTQTLDYDLYSESEWRIIFLRELLDRKRLIDPRDERNAAESAFFKSLTAAEQDRLKYLAPLNGWFAMVIYPSFDVKNAAQQQKEFRIQQEIRRIKDDPDDHGNKVERGNWPIELNLDACKHF
jgi:hypothetical protein